MSAHAVECDCTSRTYPIRGLSICVGGLSLAGRPCLLLGCNRFNSIDFLYGNGTNRNSHICSPQVASQPQIEPA